MVAGLADAATVLIPLHGAHQSAMALRFLAALPKLRDPAARTYAAAGHNLRDQCDTLRELVLGHDSIAGSAVDFIVAECINRCGIFGRRWTYAAGMLAPANAAPGWHPATAPFEAFAAATEEACRTMRFTRMLARLLYTQLRVREAFAKLGITARIKTCTESDKYFPASSRLFCMPVANAPENVTVCWWRWRFEHSTMW